MQEINHRGCDQSNADGKRRRNGAKRRNILAKKIGSIFSSACRSRRRTQLMRLATGEEEKETRISQEHRLALTDTHPCEQIQVAKVDARGTQKGNGKKRCRKRHLISSLSGIFRKSSTGFNLRKWKTIKTGSANASGTKGWGSKPGFRRIARKGDVLRGETATTRKEEKAHEAKEAKRELELCKKRILMGEKCRPLNLSGVLHYDKEGILLPEDVLRIQES